MEVVKLVCHMLVGSDDGIQVLALLAISITKCVGFTESSTHWWEDWLLQ